MWTVSSMAQTGIERSRHGLSPFKQGPPAIISKKYFEHGRKTCTGDSTLNPLEIGFSVYPSWVGVGVQVSSRFLLVNKINEIISQDDHEKHLLL